jgi:CheY-like chemotaxis protein
MTPLLKRVLVVEDRVYVRNDLRREFEEHNRDPGGPFVFVVETVASIQQAIALIRADQETRSYDVLVLDLSFDEEGTDRSGLRLASALGLLRRLGQEIPVEIVFSGYADLRTCVQTMRCGAWDVIDKADSLDGRSSYSLVVESAVTRLQSLELQAHLQAAAVPWLQQQVAALQLQYGGQVVAVWHEPEVHVVASGRDAFELELALEVWREGRAEWMYPFVVSIPEVSGVEDAQGAWR